VVPELQPTPAELAPNGWPRALLRGFKAGERAALTEVYRRHAEEIAGLLRHGFGFDSGGQRHRFAGYGSSFELQDLLHETFRRAFEPRAREAYDGIRPYGAYVGTIARNLVLRSFRARGLVLLPSAESAFTGPVDAIDEGPTPERDVHDAQVRELVAAFVATLAPDQRELLELRFVAGRSQREAADALGIGRQRVRTQELKLRAMLLAYLDTRGEGALLDGVDTIDRALIVLLGADLLRYLGEVTS
jgi:RNA polymerase sigma-70 factor (ECF subfamily)